MGILIDQKGSFRGELNLPGDKSISHRAIMIGAISKGKTRVENILDCDDCNFTAQAFREMGVDIKIRGGTMTLRGAGLKGLAKPKGPIYLGDSATSMRLLTGILAGQNFEAVLTGSNGLLKRPMRRVIEPLREMGVDLRAEDNEHPPVFIRGGRPPMAIRYSMRIPSAQVKSAILFAALYAAGTTIIEEKKISRDHTERMLGFFGADIKVKENRIFLKGARELSAREFAVPGDISSAAFFMVGATILPKSGITIKGLSLNPTRCGIIPLLRKMGARVRVVRKRAGFEPSGDVTVESAKTKGVVIGAGMIPGIIDEIPVIAVLAALSKGRTVIKGIGELRVKETDRVESMLYNLKAMGAEVRIENDSIIIEGMASLRGAQLKSYGDHRTAMAMTIAAMAADGPSRLDDPDCVTKSFPQFFDVLREIAR